MNPLIRGLFGNFVQAQGLEQMSEDDAFELFAASLILRDDLLDQVQLTELLLDPSTPGIDIALLDVNGQIVSNSSEAIELCDSLPSLEVNLHLIQVKRTPSVDSTQLLNMAEIAVRVLEGRPPAGFQKLENISDALREIFANAAQKLRSRPNVQISFVTTAGDDAVEAIMSENGRARTVADQIRGLSFIGGVDVEVFGASKLYEASRRKSAANEAEVVIEKSINLPKMPDIDQAILGVISASELLKLVQNDDGSLNERVFYENVRGFKGADNQVNTQIDSTLRSSARDLLPVLNNGVTVVATSYSPLPGDTVAISGYQIVNGCQTSHCIHLAEDALGDAKSTVYVPMRLVVTENKEVAAQITRATNSQTAVTDSDLFALTEFQKQLEEYYSQDPLGAGLTYERRSGQFHAQDVTRTRVTNITEQMRAVAAVFLDLPHLAARYPKHLHELVGSDIFSTSHRLSPYVAAAYVAYRLESAFRSTLEAKYKPIRYHILMAHKYRVFQGPARSLNDKRVDSQSAKLVKSLSGTDYVSKLREVAEAVLEASGGAPPTLDRLKRAPFTAELTSALMRS